MNRSDGFIATFARHPTAANLVMALMFVGGIFALTQINRQFFPDFGIDVVVISVPWPGASAEDVDANIVLAIEPEVRFLNGVDKVVSTSYEGLATVSIEFTSGYNMEEALSDVESAVSQVQTLPVDSEEPEVRRVVRYETVSKLVLSGPFPEMALKRFAKDLRDVLLAEGIDRVTMFGTRDEEVWVELQPDTLQQLDLKLSDIAERIRQSSEDTPSGDIGNGERQVRSIGLRRTAGELAEVELKSFSDGRKVILGDVARVSENFEDTPRLAYRLGDVAVELDIERAINTDALETAAKVDALLDKLAPTLPSALRVEQYNVNADSIRDRIGLLVTNGLGGLVLVMAVLFLFLNARVALWVAIGIPAALMATVFVMYASGQTVNMISLFGMIMAVGIVVDDAIVVGEHAEHRFRQGLEPTAAAIAGAERMAAPVISATLTTVAAFLPLFLISGIMGQIISAIPFVVVAVLLASLVECFLVLPGHMRHALAAEARRTVEPGRFRQAFDSGFETFRAGRFTRFVTAAVRYRYTTIAISVAAIVIALGAVMGGRVGFQFFPSPEPDKLYANVEMVAGTPREQTRAMLLEVDRALMRAVEQLDGKDSELVIMSLVKLGVPALGGSQTSAASTDTIGGVTVELQSSDVRDVLAKDLIRVWREQVRMLPGVDSISIRGQRAGPPGRDIDLRLRGADARSLKAASDEAKALLERFPGVSSIADDLPLGKPELILELTPRGRALGFTISEIGRQVRSAIDGLVAKRFPRGDEEVWVRVQLDRALADRDALDRIYLRAPDGSQVRLSEAVTIRDERGFARIVREDGQTQLSVTAEVDSAVTRSNLVITGLRKDGLDDIASRYGSEVRFAGRAEEQAETTADIKVGAILGLSLIYIILAWVFGSYARPLVVMAIIPLGFVGAVLGHAVWGFDLTIMSFFAILGLSGIVINDSIVLVTTIDEWRETEPVEKAVVSGACDRLRAVILTSATTIGGLSPLLFEKSLQAQFLIPMALTIVFGLAVTTLVVLILVPALIVAQDDAARWLARLMTSRPAVNRPAAS